MRALHAGYQMHVAKPVEPAELVAALPLNARVWHPAGDGPFPLVLVVHGNHRMEDFSDPGYAYLGETLASRGFIVAVSLTL